MKIRIKTDKPMEWNPTTIEDEIIYDTEEEDDESYLEEDGSLDALNELWKDLDTTVRQAKKGGRNRVVWAR